MTPYESMNRHIEQLHIYGITEGDLEYDPLYARFLASSGLSGMFKPIKFQNLLTTEKEFKRLQSDDSYFVQRMKERFG